MRHQATGVYYFPPDPQACNDSPTATRSPRRRPRTQFGRDVRRFFSVPSFALMAIGAILGCALFVLSTPDARADAADDAAFLSVLAAEGFTYDHGKSAGVIANGHRVCELLLAGAAPFDIVTAIDRAEPKIGRNDAAQFAALANAVFCPQFGTEAVVA